jgi:hypothetical protein
MIDLSPEQSPPEQATPEQRTAEGGAQRGAGGTLKNMEYSKAKPRQTKRSFVPPTFHIVK